MRRSAVAISIIVAVLLLAIAPAHAATRIRVYRGETSQGHGITFHVARTENGRFIREMSYGVTLTCEDQTTFGVGIGWGLGNSLPIIDRAFSFDESFVTDATHISGDLGKLQGSGAMRVTWAGLTDDEQAQLCTTGDLTWDVDFIRIIRRT